MADLPKRSDNDPAAQVARELKARLSQLPQGELVDLCAQLLGTYVIEGVLPLAKAEAATELQADTAGEETFAQLLKRLKAQKRDPVLERFLIDGENISVRIDGQGVLPITQYRRPVQAPSAPGAAEAPAPAREGVPGASTSIYNRALYEQQPAAGPAAKPAPARGAPAPAAAPAGKPAPASPAAQQQPGKKEEPKDRFSLIELD
jgi:hypothetical protein